MREPAFSCLLALAAAAIMQANAHAAEPKESVRPTALSVRLTDGGEFHVRMTSTGSKARAHFQGIFKDVQAGYVCTFEETEDYLWWQTSVDVDCGKDRVRVRMDSSDFSDAASIEVLSQAPMMFKLLIRDELHTWVMNGGKSLDTKTYRRAQAALRKAPAPLAASLRNMRFMVLPKFVEHVAPAPAGFALFGEILGETASDLDIASISPLASELADALVREAAAIK